jgi:hypothetical protein
MIFGERRVHDPAAALVEPRLLSQPETKGPDDATRMVCVRSARTPAIQAEQRIS